MLVRQDFETLTDFLKAKHPGRYRKKRLRTKILSMVYFDAGSNTSNEHPHRVRIFRTDGDKSLLLTHIRELLPATGWSLKIKERIISDIESRPVDMKTTEISGAV